jgi:hypothetical protein
LEGALLRLSGQRGPLQLPVACALQWGLRIAAETDQKIIQQNERLHYRVLDNSLEWKSIFLDFRKETPQDCAGRRQTHANSWHVRRLDHVLGRQNGFANSGFPLLGGTISRRCKNTWRRKPLR